MESAFLIDVNNLDQEIIEQAQHYYDYSYTAALAENIREEEKETLKIIMGSIEAKIRSNPKMFFLNSKVTEAAIENRVNTDPLVRKQRKKYNDARAKANLLKTAEKASEQKKDMIEAYLRRNNKQINSEVYQENKLDIIKKKVRQSRKN